MRVNGEKNFPKTYKIWQYIVLTNCEKRDILLFVYTVVHYLKGTVIYEGAAAPQIINGGTGVLIGGGNQVYIPEVDENWFS